MYNTLLNRYYIANANRSVTFSEAKAKLQDMVANNYLGLSSGSGNVNSMRGAVQHAARERELQGLWMRHLVKEEAQKGQKDNFCGTN